ncbi:MAG: hypothetical protein ACRDYA_08270 [Egibacteraceae bacterium]
MRFTDPSLRASDSRRRARKPGVLAAGEKTRWSLSAVGSSHDAVLVVRALVEKALVGARTHHDDLTQVQVELGTRLLHLVRVVAGQ